MKEMGIIKTNTNQKLLDSREERKRKVNYFRKLMENILHLNIQKLLGIVLRNWGTKNENTKKRASILHLHHAPATSMHALQLFCKNFANFRYTYIKKHLRMDASVCFLLNFN